ncbi:GNAT family N-acetyltransferase [Paenibacillus pinistramenti]|uniref:GNAT family N-acetyltransferase n=1 Tax=Paenibacillus pinistramenti TaxID=1768003 RepID=UPI001EF05FEB|nr:GNAT family N-acetyltransferase [Paenibacillus pinistramenti]
MLIDAKQGLQLEGSEVNELLALAVHEDEEALAAAKELYGPEQAQYLLHLYQEEGETIGLIGFQMDMSAGTMTIHHICVYPELRNQGFGRGLILEALMEQSPDTISAEVDEEAADFYRNIGFTVTSKGVDQAGGERFLCVYHAVESEDEF